jgi:D-3-phosphoglycerate dehydrogenase / 2-oxoglutarate reductase
VTTVAVTDYTFADLDLETKILEAAGCRLSAQKSFTDRGALAALVAAADCVITQFAPVDAAIIAEMRACRVIVRYGIGVDNVDTVAAAARGIPVCNVPDYCTDEVADHALAMILSLSRRVAECAALVRTGGWGRSVPMAALRTLRDMTVGVVGYGRIGREVARRLAGFKARVLVADPVAAPESVRGDGFEPAGLEDLLASSDLVTLHCPATPSTRQMINARSLATMRHGVLLVNAARGTLVDTAALGEALRSGQVGAAALDVADPEPLPAGSPLFEMQNVLLTSHVAAVSEASVRLLRESVAGIVAAVARGEPPVNVVNGVPGPGGVSGRGAAAR